MCNEVVPKRVTFGFLVVSGHENVHACRRDTPPLEGKQNKERGKKKGLRVDTKHDEVFFYFYVWLWEITSDL